MDWAMWSQLEFSVEMTQVDQLRHELSDEFIGCCFTVGEMS